MGDLPQLTTALSQHLDALVRLTLDTTRETQGVAKDKISHASGLVVEAVARIEARLARGRGRGRSEDALESTLETPLEADALEEIALLEREILALDAAATEVELELRRWLDAGSEAESRDPGPGARVKRARPASPASPASPARIDA